MFFGICIDIICTYKGLSDNSLLLFFSASNRGSRSRVCSLRIHSHHSCDVRREGRHRPQAQPPSCHSHHSGCSLRIRSHHSCDVRREGRHQPQVQPPSCPCSHHSYSRHSCIPCRHSRHRRTSRHRRRQQQRGQQGSITSWLVCFLMSSSVPM